MCRKHRVEREHDRKDRRKAMVTFNQKKLAVTNPVSRSMGEAVAGLLDNYSVAELVFLVQYHKATIELTRKEMAKLAP
jgi:hypothetical protein